MKKIYTARDGVDAHLAKAFFAEVGIESVVQGESLAQVSGAVPFSETLPSVWVRDEDAEQAAAAMTKFASAPNPHAGSDPWTCPDCGESIESQFTECWKCGASRPESSRPQESA